MRLRLLRTTLRPNAARGNLVTPDMAAAITRQIQQAFNTPQRDLILDELAEQAETPANALTPTINQPLDAPRVPPRLMQVLPPLPKQLEYDFVGRTLVIRDVDADVVIDFVRDALPAQTPPAPPAAAATPSSQGAVSPLPMPTIRGGVVFAVVGDSGSGDVAQRSVAQAMLTYFTTARHFPFVLMLGDNLYHDDYTNEFSVPYKPLLDLGVEFYAALGNAARAKSRPNRR